MAKVPLRMYAGQLSAKQIADGMNAAARNARRLFEEAEILAKASRYPTACALAILSIEESGKVTVLRGLATVANEQAAKKVWRDYRSHQAKNAAWIVVDVVMQGARTLNDMTNPMYDPKSDHRSLLDAIKQIAVYTDCLGAANWSEPPNVIGQDLCESIMLSAKVLLQKADITEREIELWSEYMGKGGGEKALREFFRALIAEGLADHTEEEVDRFLGFTKPH